ncbi:LAR-like protein, partial [Mya arenaria]
VKCLQYWPEMDQTCSFGGIDISVTGVEELSDYEIRTLIAKKCRCTFIALDNLVDQARTEKCVRPLQVVEYLICQRVNMVQTKDQYVYLHRALAEALLMGTDHVWHRQFEEVHSFMIATEPGEKQTRMVKQFQ